ncbi:hypothetical protein J7L05_00820 [bacterium]|nr:hypothetical protein [bacterium]
MSEKRKNNRFTYNQRFSVEPISKPDWNKVEDLLARLIAQAYAEDHPEQFSTDTTITNEQNNKNLIDRSKRNEYPTKNTGY